MHWMNWLRWRKSEETAHFYGSYGVKRVYDDEIIGCCVNSNEMT